jgi:adenylosuccinate lyase
MISRYARPEAAAIWSPATKYAIWFEIEAHAATAMAELGTIPKKAAETIWAKGKDAKFDAERIDAIEREVKHDVIAFLTHVAEIVGEDARFLHQGMTSSDVLDTCLSVQLQRSADLLIEGVDKVLVALKRRALEHKLTPVVGRSHGVHAEPTTFGLKLASHHAEFQRARARLVTAREEISTCAISGAVGTFAQVDPRVEAYVAEKMGLKVEPVSTQVIPRDRHAAYFAALAVVASSVERLAVEIRHLQRTEVLEAEEPFDPGQKGSSAMPHKRNPILTENLTGLARLVRSAVIPALEYVALWHERDISHSSVERGIGPDATVHLDFALRRLAGVVERLVVYPENMAANLDRLGGLVNSQRVMLALTQKGMAREAAYAAVQKSAMAVWRGEGRFRDLLKADPEVSQRLDDADLEALFDMAHHLRHVDVIFQRVFG